MEALEPAKIKDLRLSLGLSQDRFAELLNVGVASIRRWEAGTSQPIPAHQEKINLLSIQQTASEGA